VCVHAHVCVSVPRHLGVLPGTGPSRSRCFPGEGPPFPFPLALSPLPARARALRSSTYSVLGSAVRSAAQAPSIIADVTRKWPPGPQRSRRGVFADWPEKNL
jgi:hypothetical protein